jgi:hypothetical protein
MAPAQSQNDRHLYTHKYVFIVARNSKIGAWNDWSAEIVAQGGLTTLEGPNKPSLGFKASPNGQMRRLNLDT